MSFISDLRAYSRGELTEEELKASAGGTTLDETSVMIPTKPEHLRMLQKNRSMANAPSILIRSIDEATRAGADKPVHGCSVKIYDGENSSYDIAVPTTSGRPFAKLDIFMNSDANAKLKKTARSIIYDNQELIIAYWYNKDPQNPIGKTLIEILTNNIIQNNYTKNPITRPKTEEELNEAKKELQDTVRAILQDDSIVLVYDSPRKE